MADKRDCFIELKRYIESLGIKVNIGKNKARGNKGIFCYKGNTYRIDISKDIDSQAAYSTLLHEFAHFIHYKYDKSLKSLDFVFENLSEDEQEELLNVTVKNVPKEFALSLYDLKKQLSDENKLLAKKIKDVYPDFKMSEPFRKIERGLMFSFSFNDIQTAYLNLKSNQKNISKINSKINKLNKYYNQPSELWARFFELYFTNHCCAEKTAPQITKRFRQIIDCERITEISDIFKIL